MSSVFHAGERAVQSRAGVRDQADRVGRSIRREIPPIAAAFLQQQRLVVVATEDAEGHVWATPLSSGAGFARALDSHVIQIDAAPPPGDPLYDALVNQGPVGMIAVDFLSHRRMRANGVGRLTPDGLMLTCAEVYSNCGRYIQTRKPQLALDRRSFDQRRLSATALTRSQQAWVAGTDTFFIATSHPQAGADASHKGGFPGFVHVLSATELSFLDYPGNSLFNTLGNILGNQRAGLLFLDFLRGHTLQITGAANVAFEAPDQRLVHIDVQRVIEVRGALPLSFEFIEYASTNPKTKP